MSNDGKIATPSIVEALALAHERMEELFSSLGSNLPADVRLELLDGVDAILVEVLNRCPAEQSRVDDFMSTAEAATLLFISRPHVTKLLEQGELKLHHKTGSDNFVTKMSVLEYHAAREAAARTYNTLSSNEE